MKRVITNNTTLVMLAVGFVVVLLVLLFRNAIVEQTTSINPVNPLQVASSTEAQPLQETNALAPEVTTLSEILQIVTQKARKWRDDAQLFRLYATEVKGDGTFDKTRGEIQIVLTSEAAEKSGETNGWRGMIRDGNLEDTRIWLTPAPALDDRPKRLCSLGEVAGKGAPERFTVDVQWARQQGRQSSLLLFTVEPTRWMVVADPYTCVVGERSSSKTLQEEQEDKDRLVQDESGQEFDVRAASESLRKAIDRAGCKQGSKTVSAAVQVVFDKRGHASNVDFLSAMDESEKHCLRAVLMKTRVKPWNRGTGVAATRFAW